MTCWICGKPAVWRVTARKQDPPAVVEFCACEKCIPFVRIEKAKQEERPK